MRMRVRVVEAVSPEAEVKDERGVVMCGRGRGRVKKDDDKDKSKKRMRVVGDARWADKLLVCLNSLFMQIYCRLVPTQ